MSAGRFAYVAYDAEASQKQAVFKAEVERLALLIESQLKPSRPSSLALTKLEEVYMWVGKAIRDEQVAK